MPFASFLCCLVVVGAVYATTISRPLIFGSGYIYGNWKNYPTFAQQQQWDKTSLQMIDGMGGTCTGASFNWVSIEPQPGVYNWTYADWMVENALAHKLEIFAYTGNTPDWALDPSQKGQGYRFPPLPQFKPQFIAFFTALAKRYAGKVRYYEFWNEQNGCSWIHDGCSNMDQYTSYAPWLCAWYAAMKSGDPQCVLSSGGLDYHSGVQGYQYIEGLYSVGAGECFDAVALHPYDSQALNCGALSDTYNVLVQHGHGNKSLWLNEYGWNSQDEGFKSRALTQVLSGLKQGYPYVFQAMYLSLTDLPGPDTARDYGLCGQNSADESITPRTSYDAFAAFNKTF